MQTHPPLNFDKLVELHYQPVFSFALSLCGKLDRALELTQRTFCIALERQAYVGERGKAKLWLLTLLFREFLKARRLERQGPGCPPGRVASKRAPATSVAAALRKLRDELRVPLILFYAKDFSCSQIAEHLGIPMGAVISRLGRGREELSLALETRSRFTAGSASARRSRRAEKLSLAA